MDRASNTHRVPFAASGTNSMSLLSAISTPEGDSATYRQIRDYLIGRHPSATAPQPLFHAALKFLLMRMSIGAGIPATTVSAKDYRHLWADVRKRFGDLFDTNEDLDLDTDALEHLHTLTAHLSFSLSGPDHFGAMYEVFLGREARGHTGQFFTPANAARLLVELIDPDPEWHVLDPSCGSGGLLGAAASLAVERGASPEAAGRLLVGIDKDNYLVSLTRARLALLGSAPTVHHGDSLSWVGLHGALPPMEDALYDAVLSNPPFSAKVSMVSDDTQRKFQLGRRWRQDTESGRYIQTDAWQSKPAPQVLFVERCISLVRPGGMIGMVLPESLLASPKHAYAVAWLRDHADIHAVVGMPEDLFKTAGSAGTHAKTCLVVAQKHGPSAEPPARVFMAEAKRCGHDSRGRSGVYHDDLAVIAERRSSGVSENHLGYWLPVNSIVGHILAPRYYDPEVSRMLASLTGSHDLVTVGDLIEQGVLSVATGDEVGKAAYGTGDIPFIRTSDIANWEVKIDPKHRVSEDIYRALSSKQDVRADDILMVRDGTYLIGTCAIITEHDIRMVFQSHLLKIRVTDHQALSPYLLLALLSSEPVRRQVLAKRLTQDVIDTLGNRLREIVLPISKSAPHRKRVAALVHRVIRERSRAREWAREACLEVVSAA